MHGIHSRPDPKFGLLSNLLFRIFDRINIRTASIVTSVSLPDATEYRNKFNKRILYIPNGVNVPLISNTYSKDEYISFAANRIYEIKGLHILLRALKSANLNMRLKIIGDLSHNKSYQTEIMHLAGEMNVEFVDRVDKNRLFELISNSKFFVFPSKAEAMSMMLLEVAALGVPIIASDIPSNKVVFNHRDVLYFKNDDYQDLSAKIRWALNNPQFMKEKACAAQEKTRIEYSWEGICRHYLRLFNLLSFHR